MQANFNLKLYRGDTREFHIALENIDPNDETITQPVNLGDVTLKAQVRAKQDSPDVWANLPIVMINSAEGKFKIVIDKQTADTLGDVYDQTLPSNGYWDLELTSKDGKHVYTPVKGTVTIEKDTTREY